MVCQTEVKKMKTNHAKLQTKASEAKAPDKGQWESWVNEVGKSLHATDAQELAMELLIEKVGSTHETDEDKAHYESLLTELAAAVKTAEYHVDGVQSAA